MEKPLKPMQPLKLTLTEPELRTVKMALLHYISLMKDHKPINEMDRIIVNGFLDEALAVKGKISNFHDNVRRKLSHAEKAKINVLLK
jgi:hypothetical protein